MTKRQSEVLAFVRKFITENGVAPSLVEIGEAIGAHKVSARSLLIRLHAKGHIIRGPGLWRNIKLPETIQV